MGEDSVQDFITEHAAALDSAFENVEMSDTMRENLRHSDWMFSGLKTFHELKEAFPSLLDENGRRKPFERFLNDVQKVDETYNRHYLRAEYNFANASASMASRWESFTDDNERFRLQYRTQNDGSVRPEHQALHGVTLPKDDPFWDSCYPPLGWNCRCTVVEVPAEDYPTTPRNEAENRAAEAMAKDKKGIFRFNSGKERRTFPAYNPYSIEKCRNCPKGRIGLAAQDNELCKACALTQEQYRNQYDITERLKGLQEKKGRELQSSLKEMSEMKVFKPVEKGIKSAINENDQDYSNLMGCARKLVKKGYSVYLLPNPKNDRTPDYLLVKKNYSALYELKTVTGKNSVSDRLKSSVGQSRRVILDIKNNISAKVLSDAIYVFFNDSDVLEILVFKGSKMISVKMADIDRNFGKRFAKSYYQ